MGGSGRDPMLDLFVFESTQLTQQLEQLIIDCEKNQSISSSIDEIFRVMHTLKGSAAMMLFDNIARLAHSLEDIFHYLRENRPQEVDVSKIGDLSLSAADFIKQEIQKIEAQADADGDPTALIELNKGFLQELKSGHLTAVGTDEPAGTPDTDPGQKYYIHYTQGGERIKYYKARVFFEAECKMETTRAFLLIHQLAEFAEDIRLFPEDICDNDKSAEFINANGFQVIFRSKKTLQALRAFFRKVPFQKSFELTESTPAEKEEQLQPPKQIVLDSPADAPASHPKSHPDSASVVTKQNMISVHVDRLDRLMDLVGELVISEEMVARNPDLQGLQLNNFEKAARQLKKISNEIQDAVMAIRMVPLGATFQKMNRLVRDMSHKLNRQVELEMIGQETEVDKNIIDHLNDPLMHIIRNAIDHGLEPPSERVEVGKPRTGKIVLEAKQSSGDVWIVIRDDGRGLNKEKILDKARSVGLLRKPEKEYTDAEAFALILQPGFSTKEQVTEYSGRGVGMDVVTRNIEKVGGTVIIGSQPGLGTTISLKIPLTLVVEDGMILRVGKTRYTVPTASIVESLRVKAEDVIIDPDGNEMVMIRGQCYAILRLHRNFNVVSDTTAIHEGIVVMVEADTKSVCIFADELLGEQQVVVKALPGYLKKVKGITGCTLMGDGGISLILDAAGLASEA